LFPNIYSDVKTAKQDHETRTFFSAYKAPF